jgi:D-beta-D-heptose 7-phosphate kinase/D-beta-D-heptose 1-phosphate adenosyltransferase
MTQQRPIALVIGDVMLDVRTEGEMVSISLEAPAPVIRQTAVTESLGGAGNVARNIKALGHEVLLMGLVGNDAAGETIARLASTGGIMACLPKWSKATIVKHRITSGGQIVARVDKEEPTLSPYDEKPLFDGLYGLPPEQIERIKVIVIADYNKGTMTPDWWHYGVQQFAFKYHIPVFVDARPAQMHLYNQVTLLKPNLDRKSVV